MPTPFQAATIDDATIAEIEQEMTGDGVWIDPAFARSQGISAADEAAIEEAVASSQTADVKVVLVEIDYDDARFQGNFTNLSAWVQDDLGGSATYVGWDGVSEPASVSIQEYGEQPDAVYVANVVANEHPGDLVAQVVRVPELIDDGNAEQLWREVPRDERYSWTADEGVQTSEVLGGIGVGIGVVVAVAAVVAGLVAWRRRRDRPTRFSLPGTVLHTVRSAEDRRLRQQADDEVLALGEAIGSGEPTGTSNALAAWQQALDHYAAARSILSQEARPADVVGALVLARRGQDARAAAGQRKPPAWRPRAGCWFNPLHEGPTTEVTWRGDDRAVDVPACRDCAAAVRAGREPDDVLDFIEGERTVHYYRLDLGAWSTTGYGALDRDLIGALRRREPSRRRVRGR